MTEFLTDAAASMRIVIAASKFLPEYTGAAYRIDRLYRGLLAQNPAWSASVLCGGIEHCSRADYDLAGLRVHRVRSRAASVNSRLVRLWAEVGDFREALQYLRSIRCDLIHTIGTAPVVAAAIHHAKHQDIPILVELVTDGAEPDQGLPVIRRWRRPDLHFGAAIVAISPQLGESCRRRGYDGNVWIRPNPVATAKFFVDPQARARLRAEVTPFGECDVVIASIAKFMAQKNQIFLLDVLAQLPERFKLVLAGPLVRQGPLASRDFAYFTALNERVAQLRLSERVHIVPEFVAAEKFTKAANIVAMPSVQEGLGTPLLEAQACALPVVANAKIPGFSAYVEEGVTGFLRELDPMLWASAMQAALELNASARERAANKIAEQYSESVTNTRYSQLLQALASAGPRARINICQLFGTQSTAMEGAPAAV